MATRLILFHLASGQAFFSGSACLVLAAGLAAWAARRWARTTRNLLVGVGGVLVGASATPLPVAADAGLAAVTLAWLVGEARRDRWRWWRVRRLRGLMAASWVIAALAEAPYHLIPHVPPLGSPVLGVIGDSVTAGVDDRAEVTWPRLLGDRHGLIVRDHAAAGATAASAASQAAALKPDQRLVIVEIGGNDLLGGTTPVAFEAGLERLLAATCRPGRVVVLLELPLLPTYAEFGRAQRRLARRFGALLVPKRVLLGVLLADGATLDTIHPSALGHEQLAEAIWAVIRPAYVHDDR